MKIAKKGSNLVAGMIALVNNAIGIGLQQFHERKIAKADPERHRLFFVCRP